MKIAIKTAHGYLSFQPPGVADGVVPPLQYRQGRGVWEEIDLEGLDAAIEAIVEDAVASAGGSGGGTGPNPPTPPTTAYPFGITPSPSGSYVAAIKDALVKHGTSLAGPCGAFEITKHVSYGLSLTSPAYGLLSKPSGNNCQGYATDIVMRSDGQGYDILGDGGGTNNPQWGETDVDDGVGRFRPAIRP